MVVDRVCSLPTTSDWMNDEGFLTLASVIINRFSRVDLPLVL